jgi:transcriptional regulator with XRE-family HTH domain
MKPAQCRAARALLNWSQPELAAAAALGLMTIVDFERARREVQPKSVAAIQRALESAGIIFLTDVYLGVGLQGAGFDPEPELNEARANPGTRRTKPRRKL